MKLGGGKEWFTAAELAELAAPGLPTTKRKINERAAKECWALRTAQDGSPLARPRAGVRGGGLEYHLLALPASCRPALVKHGIKTVADMVPAPVSQPGDRWAWFNGQSDSVREEATERMKVLDAVQLLKDAGISQTAAIATIAAREGVSIATINAWRALVKGVPAADRLPWLAPHRSGGGKEVEVDAEAWQLLKSDYLRPSPKSFSACYDSVKRKFADKRGLVLPSERTLRRKLEREVDPRVIILLRKGEEALRQTLPPTERSVADLHALEAVNIDGHKWDVFVRWPDGYVGRPIMVGIADIHSRKFLAWSVGRTESAVETRLAFAHLFERYGIPDRVLMDNGRALASKWITGGAKSRFRFKIRPEEPLGLLTALDIKIDWAKPYRGQSKPIERTWRDFCDTIAKDAAFEGAYTGNKPDAKPENYGSRAIPLKRFMEVIEDGFAFHNSKPNRDTEMGGGTRSFDDVFNESYAVSPIRKATPDQLRMALLTADDRPTDPRSGAITMYENRYWTEELGAIAGDKVTVRFDPDDLHAPIHVYSREGQFICTAPVQEAAGFFDVDAAKRRARLEKDFKRKVKDLAAAEQLLDADRVAALYDSPLAAEVPDAKVVRPARVRGHTVRALKTTAQAVPSAASEAAQNTVLHQLAAGARRLRAVD